ncbi:amidoxime reducing component 2 [Hyphodiscus hymeniophilus]|uniref:Amidoxime reducing component 2 n=1 Tax=Hyphodiscus hymeniophilus TaxID=353542 RepID=A0A9P6VMI1_9HELO|nr:amidoxime reducing component 2 [Hyphodiscus hymeniophilus]
MTEGVELARKIFEGVPEEQDPVVSVNTVAEIKTAIQNEAFSHHATSTCAIGLADIPWFVSTRDFGSFPTLPICMVSEKATDCLLKDIKLEDMVFGFLDDEVLVEDATKDAIVVGEEQSNGKKRGRNRPGRLTQLHIYPIKSLRGISLPSATLCAQGLAHDRRYILLKPRDNGTYENMFVGIQPEMALFHCKLSSPSTFTVEYHIPSPPLTNQTPSQNSPIRIPFEPDYSLQKINIELHASPSYPVHRMPDYMNQWFSECFGYEVILAYLGDGLGIEKKDEKAKQWLSTIKPRIPQQLDAVNFSDGAALLVTSEISLADLHPRLPDGEEAVLEKFRPNIVVDGEGTAWEEDFWAELTVRPSGVRIVLTSNCARCTSINVDLEKGRMGEGESGKLLKKLMRDRRVDSGNKWSPVFGRYGFPTQAGELRIGDEVLVSKRNEEHTVWNGVMPRLVRFEEVTV